jgi:pseudouridylate synthase
MAQPIRVLPQVDVAIANGRPVVALESSVLAQGLPIPHNRVAADRMVGAVEREGAVAAITAVVRGTPTVGLEPDELERFLRRDGVRKVSARDLPFAMVTKADGATTVAATLALASAAGVEVFATGGIGGVHRDAPFDESADLAELARTPMIVVCAGAKSILDLEATLERLESLGIPVVGFRTDQLPGFFSAESGIDLDTRVESAAQIAEIYRAHRALGRRQSLLVVQAPPPAFALARERVETAVHEAQREAAANGIRGARVTPFLLAAVTRLTGGSSLDANLALLEQNARLAAEVATMCSEGRERAEHSVDNSH